MANSVLRQTIHTSLAKTLLSEINTRSVKYYFSYGKTDNWSTPAVPTALDTYPYEFQARKDTVFLQEVTPGDACLVIPRVNWVSGSIYDYYDNYSPEYLSYTGSSSLEGSLYYVVTDDLNVYKCLDNNNNSVSTIKPSTTGTQEFRTSDDYVWKYMYTIPPFLSNKFLSTTQMPVANAVQQMYYSDGKLEKFVIESKGSGYLPNRILDGSVASQSVTLMTPVNYIGNGTTTVTITLNSAYGLIAGTPISVTGAVGTQQTKINGTFYITSVDELANTFTIIVSTSVSTGTYTTGLGTSLGTMTRPYDYRKIWGTNTTFLTDFQVGDYFVVNGEVRQIGSIESDTELTIKSDDPHLYILIQSSITKLNTYLYILDGDGYKEENPYMPVSITITNQGSGYSSNLSQTTITLSVPQLPLGRIARAVVTEVTAGKITGITITDPGYGYTSTPTVVSINDIRISGNTGAGASAIITAIKSKAYLEPLISGNTGELINIVPSYPGIGYTYATITPLRFAALELPEGVDAWSDAIVSVDFNFGRLDSKQADVELSAVNGAIHMIKLTRQGIGYSAGTTITITGDGIGCLAQPVIESGVLKRILVTNIGQDYTYATATITPGAGTTPTVTALPRVVISPPGGHGKSAVDELLGRTLAMFNRLKSVKLKAIDLSNVEYRQLCLYRQPRIFGSQLLYNGTFASTAYKISVVVGSAPALSTIPLNTVLRITDSLSSNVSIRFRLIQATTNEMILQAIDNYDEYLANNLVVVHPNGTSTYKVAAITKPDVEKSSGDIIYIDNRAPFKPLVDQTVSISSRFKF